MRTHADIIAAAGVPKIADILADQSVHTIRSWRQRDSIPGEYWATLAEEGIATLEELAAAAAKARPTAEPQRLAS